MYISIETPNKKINKGDLLLFILFAIMMLTVFAAMFNHHSNATEHIKAILNNSGVQVNDATFTKTNLGDVYKSSEPLVCEDGTVSQYWKVWYSMHAKLILSVTPYTGDMSRIVEV